MKRESRWLAGMAAVVMAATLMAMPREGAAWPIRYFYPEGGPVFGVPDTPVGRTQLVRPESCWLGPIRIRVWVSGALTPMQLFIYEPRSPKVTRSSKATTHE